LFKYYDKVIKGTEHEDAKVILQFLKSSVGEQFSFLNYYREIPVSYDAKLVSVENDMAEFELHEYQAKAISLERKTLIRAHKKSPFREDIVADVFYVNIAKKLALLQKFGYAKINSESRRFVRIVLGTPASVHISLAKDVKLSGVVNDISLGGAAVSIEPNEFLAAGSEVPVRLVLNDPANGRNIEMNLRAKIVKVIDNEENKLFGCMLEFCHDKDSQQQISYFINQQQVLIIKELKELVI